MGLGFGEENPPKSPANCSSSKENKGHWQLQTVGSVHAEPQTLSHWQWTTGAELAAFVLYIVSSSTRAASCGEEDPCAAVSGGRERERNKGLTLEQLPLTQQRPTKAYSIRSMLRAFETGAHESNTGEIDPS